MISKFVRLWSMYLTFKIGCKPWNMQGPCITSCLIVAHPEDPVVVTMIAIPSNFPFLNIPLILRGIHSSVASLGIKVLSFSTISMSQYPCNILFLLTVIAWNFIGSFFPKITAVLGFFQWLAFILDMSFRENFCLISSEIGFKYHNAWYPS